MMMQNQPKHRTLPGVSATLAAGFDLTARHLWLILIPVLLDGFLWLGPRLSIRPLIEQLSVYWPQDPNLEPMLTQLLAVAPYSNLYSLLSIPLIGVPVLLAGLAPEKTPLPTAVSEISSPVVWFAYFSLFLLIGLMLTAIYYSMVAQVVRKGQETEPVSSMPKFLNQVARTWLLLFLVGIFLFLLALILYLPMSLITFAVTLLSPILGLLVLLGGLLVMMWVVLAGFFLPQSVTLYGRPPHVALQESFIIIRRYGSSALTLILAVILVRNLLGQALMFMEDGSWITAVSILAHAFVSTSLLAAVFIFYRDRIRVMQPTS